MLIALSAALALFQEAPAKPVPPLCGADAGVTQDCLNPLDDTAAQRDKPDSGPIYGLQNYPRDEAIMDAVNAQREAEQGDGAAPSPADEEE